MNDSDEIKNLLQPIAEGFYIDKESRY